MRQTFNEYKKQQLQFAEMEFEESIGQPDYPAPREQKKVLKGIEK